MAEPKQDRECCPEFDPEIWDKQTHQWNSKAFIKESMPLLFHIPFPPMIKKKIMKMWKLAEDSEKMAPNKEDILVLFSDPHPFKSELFFSVTGSVPEANNVELSGTFKSRVFDGPYNAVPKFMKDMDSTLAEKGEESKRYYVHYAYCPECAKKSGHNYMILFAEI
jgi:hypothetical protein